MSGRVWGGRTEAASPPLDDALSRTSELPRVLSSDPTEVIERVRTDAGAELDRTMLLEPIEQIGPEYDGLFRGDAPTASTASANGRATRQRRWGTSLAAERQERAKRAKRKNKRLNVLITAFALVLALGGGAAVWQGMQLRQIDAPLPEQEMSQCTPPNCKPTGEDGTKPVEVLIDDGTTGDGWSDGSDGAGGNGNDKGSKKGTMTVPTMANSSVFLPALGAYAPVLGTNQTKESRHAGWQTLMIPTNPRKVSWYSGGSDLAGGTEGTTLLAGHIAYNGVNGSFRWLANAKPGNLVYTKNANGATQKWVVDKVFYRKQTDFPQSYWSAEGPRQLIMVTCGGSFSNGHYNYNVFVSAVPAT